MRKLGFLIILFTLIVFLAGCSALKFANRSDDATPVEGVKAAPTPAPPKSPAITLFENAKQRFVKGAELLEAGELEEAKVELDAALSLCLQDYDKVGNKAITAKIESLFLEICLNQVRLGHLRGTYETVLPEDSPLGLELNPDVERWLAFWLTNGRRSMSIYLSRSGKYLPMIEKVLKEEGLPEELKYLPMIESGYSPYAYSSASAVGLWQFINSTGKRFGLQIDSWVDERRDPAKATRAAAAYLKQLHGMFDSWPLAMASYNCGEGRVGGAIRRNNTNDYWQLDLPMETCNYVPKFFAAMIIARDPEMYGFFVTYEDPLAYEEVILERPADMKVLASITGLNYNDLKDMNPELLSQYTHPKVNGYKLKVPKTHHAQFLTAFNATSGSQKYLSKAAIAKLKAPARKSKIVYHVVKKGDSLYTIARKYHTTVQDIKKWNKSARGKFIKPGMKLKIYPGRK